MTPSVSPAIATTAAPAAGQASREAETSAGGFDEVLDATGPRAIRQKAHDETAPNTHRLRKHGTGTDAADAPVPEQTSLEKKLEDADSAIDDGAPVAETLAETDAEGGEDVDDGEEDTSLPVRMKAEHTISMMMSMTPAKLRSATGDAAGQKKADEAPDGVGTMRSKAGTNLAADQPAETSATSEAEAVKDGQTRVVSLVDDDASAASAPQANNAASTRKAQSGVETAAQDAKASGAKPGGNQDIPAASDQPAAVASQKAVAGGSDSGSQANAGARGQRGGTPDVRRPAQQPAAVTVSVVSQQAVPAPAATPALGANAAAIVTAIAADQGWRPISNSSTAAFANAQPMRSLQIQLHPADLGTVTANLRSTGGQLSVELHVETREAYHRLNADSDAIVKSLQALGYDIDRVSVQQPQAATTAAARADANAGTGSFSRDGSSFQPGSSGSSGERFGGGHASGRGDQGEAQRNDQAQQVHRDRVGSGLYI